MFRLIPATIEIKNHTDYPDAEVKRLILHEAKQAEIRNGITITVRYSSRATPGAASGRWRPYWYPGDGEDRPQILIRLPRPGAEITDYHPYPRKREQGKRFPLADWREALVSIAAHELEHARQHQAGERAGRRKSGHRRSQVEIRCDLAAWRAWRAYREQQGEAEVA